MDEVHLVVLVVFHVVVHVVVGAEEVVLGVDSHPKNLLNLLSSWVFSCMRARVK